jgi:hypothetical protein
MKSINTRRPKGLSFLIYGILTVAFASVLAACDPGTKSAGVNNPPPVSSSPSAPASPVASPVPSASGSPVAGNDKLSPKVEAMTGRWTGPEGTYLNVTKKGSGYSVEVKNLDGSKTFDGTAKGDSIEFTRNGKTETIKSATGAETGMKGFEKETNCLVITKGSEGFCRK